LITLALAGLLVFLALPVRPDLALTLHHLPFYVAGLYGVSVVAEWRPFGHQNAHKLTLDHLGRPISDSLSALICYGVFDRHPNLRVAAVENGAVWLGPLLGRLSHAYGQMPKAFSRHPVETFKQHIFVAPFFEDDTEVLRQLMPANRILFGSDFPHPEGLAEPLDYVKEFPTYSDEEIKRVFHSNLKGLLEGVRDEAA